MDAASRFSDHGQSFRRRGGRRGPAIAAVVAALVAAGLLFAYLSWVGYVEARETAARRAADLATLLADRTHVLLTQVERNLKGLAARIPPAALSDAEPGRVETPGDIAAAFPAVGARGDEVGEYMVLDADGNLRFTQPAGHPEKSNFRDEAWFQALRASAPGRLYIADEFAASTTLPSAMIVAWPITDATGAFAGAAAVAWNTAALESVLSAVDIGRNGMAALRRIDDNEPLLCRPNVARDKVPAATTPVHRLVKAGQRFGVADYVSPVVGIERTYGFRAVDGFDIYAVVGAAKVDYLTGWRKRIFSAALLGLLLVGGLGMLIRRQQRSETNLELRTAALRQAEFVGGLGHWEMDFGSGQLRCSNQMCRIFGLDAPTTSLDRVAEVIHPVDRERVASEWTAAKADSDRFESEYRIVVDNQVRHVSEHALFERDAQGRIVYGIGTVLDVTDRKVAEATQAREHAMLQTIVEVLPDHLFVKDIDGVYQMCNPAMQRALGMREEEIVGHTDVEIFGERVGERHRERDVVVMTTGTTVSYAERMQNRDGDRLWIEKTKVAMRDADGNCVGVLGVARDVTLKRRDEQALIESEARFRSLADSTPVMIWMMDGDGTGVYFNRAWLSFTGRTLDHELTCRWRDDIHPDDIDSTLRAYQAALEKRCKFSIEFRKRRHDGEWRWVLDNGAPRVDRHGTVLGFIGSLVDITERKQFEDALAAVGDRLQLAMNAARLIAFEHVTGSMTIPGSPELHELIGTADGDIGVRTLVRRVHPEDRPQVIRMLLEEVEPGQTIDFTSRIRLPDGQVRWVRTMARVLSHGSGTRLIGVGQDVTAKALADLALAESERKYRTLLEAMAEGVCVLQDGRLAFANPALANLLGYDPPQLLGMPVDAMIDAADAGSFDLRGEVQLRHRDGARVWTELTATPMQFAGRPATLVLVRDTSERRRAAQRLRDANRRLQALVDCRQALVRADSEEELLRTVCKVVVDTAGYRFAFVAYAENDAGKTIRPIASAGIDAGYLDQLNLSWADVERGRGPTGTAIRTGQPAIARVATAPNFAPWREAATSRGFAANLSLPLLTDGRAFGAFAIYSGDADAFDVEESSLLSELANDLAFGIVALRARAARQLAEDALRESEAKHRTLVDAMAEGVCVVHDRRILFANAALASMLRTTVAELLGMPIDRIAPVHGRAALTSFFEGSDDFAESPPQRNELELSRGEGGNFVAELIATAMVFNGQRAALVIVRDIDDLKRAERALVTSEHFLRDVIESTSDGLLVEDRDGRTLAANRRFMQMWNVPAQMMQAQSGVSLHAHVLAQLDNARQIPTRSADLDRMEQWRDYHLLEVNDGRLIARNASPLLRDGVVAGRVWSFRDVTERRKTELLYRSVIESSPDAFLAIDEEGRIVDWSPRAEELFGWSAIEVIGRPWTSTIVPVAYRDTHDAGLRRFIETGESHSIGRVLRQVALRRDGSEFPVELQIGAVRVGKRWRFTSFVRDISARVLAEQQVAQSQRLEAIGQLTGGLAHDFNNMLGIILGSLDLLSIELGTGDKEALELISAAQSAAHRGVEVTKSLLAVARRQPLAPKLVDVDAALREMKPLLVQTAGKRVSLSLLLRAGAVNCYLDPGGFNNAVLNLVINARDAMPDGGHLHIATEVISDNATLSLRELPPGSYVSLTVRDSGCGMVPEVVERAFDPFFSTKERGKGTGLGLAMVYGFARQSNGAAVIDSLVGSGTTVQLLLPVAVGRYPIDSAAPVGASSPAVARGERVLVVDDEVDLRRIVRDYLVAAGYDVTMAGSPAEALSLLETAPFELLISDIVMPGDMDGADLARVAAGRYPEMRILLISGYADDVVARIPGQCRLLEKPFRQHDLQQAVRAMLDERTGESD